MSLFLQQNNVAVRVIKLETGNGKSAANSFVFFGIGGMT
ncbi:hypothetical protein PITCH_A380003 [uncultured Desulfobacterium sp.]|uniref:Uncharacterized protein n=1 Tax=uncultured Desulfobacterium sp. TaxID=201089 RepID=A0A445MZH0_9BACT|nr:hypothetical protein PITCH_A380003 [uncultured Desulfobacterium sp.]